MQDPVIREHGESLRLTEPVSSPESAAPRELKSMGYDAGAQRVRPNRTDRSGLFGGLVVAQLAQQLGIEGGETAVHFGSGGPAGTRAEGAVEGGEVHLSVGPEAMFTRAGRQLAAHELAHIAQPITNSEGTGRADRTQAAEADADRAADAVVEGRTAEPSTSRGPEAHFKVAQKPSPLSDAAVNQAVSWYAKSGYSAGRLRQIRRKVGAAPDGNIGPVTVRAIAAWQGAHGLAADGVVGPLTLAVMFPKVAQKTPKKGPAKKPPPGPAAVPPTAGSTIEEKMAWWDTHAPKADYRKVNFRGVRMNRRTVALIRRAESVMVDHFDHRKFQFSLTQGSYNTGVGLSAGTHDGGGALDIRVGGYSKTVVDDMVRSLRIAGFAAWSRGRGYDTFDPHIHGIAIGDKEASGGAKSQVVAYGNGRNGLSGNAVDADEKLKAKSPTWAKKHL